MRAVTVKKEKEKLSMSDQENRKWRVDGWIKRASGIGAGGK